MNKKEQLPPIQISIELMDGTIKVSAAIYYKLSKAFMDLTKVTVIDALNAVKELTEKTIN
jgi:hypothetical protein